MKKRFLDQILRKLANLQFAIGLLFAIGFLIAIGTFIEQDQSLLFYQQNYPEVLPLYGFFTWKIITIFNLDRVYTAPWFVLILVLFSISLLACTLTVQLPSLRRFKRWEFLSTSTNLGREQFQIPSNSNNIFGFNLYYSNFHLFKQARKTYAYSGLLGRVGPIIVHVSIILLLVGSTLGSFGGYTVQEIVPRGEFFHLQNLVKTGGFSFVPQNLLWRVNDFWITYTNEFKINQFYSDLSLLDDKGTEIRRKKIFVNEPFVYKGLTLYQTDWDLVGLKLKLGNDKNLQIPVKKIIKGGRKFWSASISNNEIVPTKISILVNDLRGNVYLYDEKGNFLNETTIGDRFMLSETTPIMFSELLTSTGLQIKIDPGLNMVYISFFLLICSVYASFISYSQVWGVEASNNILLGGKSNRAVLLFQSEFRKLINKMSLY